MDPVPSSLFHDLVTLQNRSCICRHNLYCQLCCTDGQTISQGNFSFSTAIYHEKDFPHRLLVADCHPAN